MFHDTRLGADATPLPDAGLLPSLQAAQARHARRALEQAAEHGIALLEALGLPRLVTSDAEPIDPAELGDAVDQAIAVLDEADAEAEDLEEGGDDEPALGWCERMVQAYLGGGGSSSDEEETLGWTAGVCQLDLGHNTADGEHTLGAPERHPYVASLTSPWFEPAAGGPTMRDGSGHSQARWAQGERQDGEGEAEAGYDLPCDEDERCASGDVDSEPSIGWPEDFTATLDPTWSSAANADREADPLDNIWTPGDGPERHASRTHAKQLGREFVQRARAIRRGERAPEKPAGNLVPGTLRLVGVRSLPWWDGSAWMGVRVHG